MLEDFAVDAEELTRDGLDIEGAAPLPQPALTISRSLRPGERGQIELEQRAHGARACFPAKGGEPRAARLLAPEMREGYPLVITRGADEEEVLVLPRLQGGVAAAVRDEAAQDLPERGAVESRLGELDEEDAPRLILPQRPELADDAVLQPLRVRAAEAQFVGIPLE